jgi:hypothetical protein
VQQNVEYELPRQQKKVEWKMLVHQKHHQEVVRKPPSQPEEDIGLNVIMYQEQDNESERKNPWQMEHRKKE